MYSYIRIAIYVYTYIHVYIYVYVRTDATKNHISIINLSIIIQLVCNKININGAN